MKRFFIKLICCLCLAQVCKAQFNFPLIDSIYMERIKTVQIHPIGRPLENPVIPLGKDKLKISFDDMGADNHYYRYTVIHCDRYWEPSEINYNEYISGFENVLIEGSDFSVATYQPYRHYSFFLPNDEMNLLISGNYLLVVYEEDSGDILFTRRFQVYEPQLKIDIEIVRPVFGNRYRTGQQLEITAYSQNYKIISPQRNLLASIKQNGKWYSGAMLPPRSSMGNTYYWNYPGKPVFDALREFRLIDVRSTDSRKLGIDSIKYIRDTINLYSVFDFPRAGGVYHTLNDLNGLFFIKNEDSNRDSDISSQYVKAHFILKYEHELEKDLYIIGGLTQWNFLPGAKLKYNPTTHQYHTSLYLKQGVYSYLYATKNEKGRPDVSIIEGNDFNTENSYEVFIYYKSIADRYDRLIGYLQYPQVRK